MKRVECDKCEHFISPIFKEENNLLSSIKTRARCNLGKRIMFRIPKFLHHFSYTPYYDGGYIRYCNEFSSLRDTVNNI